MSRRTVFAAVLVGLVGMAYGGPATITYQGCVTNSAGLPVTDGDYAMRFSVFAVPTGGSWVWQETETTVTVKSGLFSVTLGDGTPFGTLFSARSNLWMEVAIDLNKSGTFQTGETYGPRQKMAGAAWAMWSQEAQGADLLDGYHANAFVRSVLASTGLLRSGTSNTLTLSANTVYLQRRVTGTAAAGHYVTGINADGSVVTSVDRDTTYSAGAGLSLLGRQFAVLFGGTGAANSASRSDHGHDGTDWLLTGNTATSGTHFLGTNNNAMLELRANGQRVMRFVPNALGPNVIGGEGTNNVTGGVGGVTIAGGRNNQASGDDDTIGGGASNRASGNYSTVAGGTYNHALAGGAAVGGGMQNETDGIGATVAGGGGNAAARDYSVVGGGFMNQATSESATIAGGLFNTASGYAAAIGGGQGNESSGANSTVAGGNGNQARGDLSTIGGGFWNVARGYASFVGGGGSLLYGTPTSNTATGDWSAVVGGDRNVAGGRLSFVGGGFQNMASASLAFVGGGYDNYATSQAATVAGGYGNSAAGPYATIPGGLYNRAFGEASFAAGNNAFARHRGAFVWADVSVPDVLYSTADNQFLIRAAGGVGINTDNTTSFALRVAGKAGISDVLDMGPGGANNRIINVADPTANQDAATKNYVDSALIGLDADTLDGQHGSYYLNAGNINAGTLGNSYFSAFSDLGAEGYLGNGGGDLAQNNGTLQVTLNADLLDGQHASAFSLTSHLHSHNSLTGLGADDHPQYFNLSQNENVAGIPAFNGGSSGVSAPFSVDSTYLVGSLNADMVDGIHGTDFWRLTGNNNATSGTHYVGTSNNIPLDFRSNNQRALRLEYAASGPNVIGGGSANYVRAGVSGATISGGGSTGMGTQNIALDSYAAIGGGLSNRAGSDDGTVTNAPAATIGGGSNNIAGHEYTTVGGGWYNEATNQSATVAGGYNNKASGYMSTIGGGANHRASDNQATVGGGVGNTASGNASTIAGGSNNKAMDFYATVGGGISNAATAYYTTVAGGQASTASAYYAFVGGGTANHAMGQASVVAGGEQNLASEMNASIGGGYSNVASGMYSTIAGGYDTTASAQFATVGGGRNNTAGASDATVGGGTTNNATDAGATVAGGGGNTASGNESVVGGGGTNTASGLRSTVAGGSNNIASGEGATVGGGGGYFGIPLTNTASGDWSTISGGSLNTASGGWATVPGGRLNAAAGNYSFATGRRAKANLDGCFVWADSTDADYNSVRANQFSVRADGGARFDVNLGSWVEIFNDGVNLINTNAGGPGARLTIGGVWVNGSSRDAKEHFAPVSGREVLERLMAVPITTWNYIVENSNIRHMGPMAQDLYAAFGLGDSDKTIGTVDADGVALAAIQGLYELLREKDAQIADQKREINDLTQRMAALEAAVSGIKQSR